MVSPTPNPRTHRQWLTIIAVAGWMIVWSSPSFPEEKVQPSINLQPFRAMVEGNLCADSRNRLLIIDRRYVLWDRASNRCPDNTYSVMLFGGNPHKIICTFSDSIAGPQERCRDDQFRDLFHRIIQHLQDPTLGLGPDHLVEQVSLIPEE